jgi:hypothetical protein
MSLIKPDFVERLRLQGLFDQFAARKALLLVVGRMICDCDDQGRGSVRRGARVGLDAVVRVATCAN